jgi:alkyl hydroperoxide reductase subunit AhpC
MDELRKLLKLYSFNVSIASDPTMEVYRNYRAMWLRGIALRKITYVIDKKGIIRGRINHQLLSEQPWSQVMRILKELNSEQLRKT